MNTRMWIAFSLFASVLWGLTYVIDEQVYRRISILASISIASFFAFVSTLAAAYFGGKLGPDLKVIASSRQALFLVVVGTITFVAAELFIGLSISQKNATLASLIEISYPLFIALFADLFFKEGEMNLITLIGGILIIAGVLVIWIFSG